MRTAYQVGLATVLGALFAVLTSGGCGGQSGPPRFVVKGSITFQGNPVEKGTIRFFPIMGTTGPMAGADIVAGKYVADAKGGVPQGKYRVEIEAFRTAPIPPGVSESAFDQGPPREQYIPAKYNRQSELQIEVLADGSRVFNFDLQ